MSRQPGADVRTRSAGIPTICALGIWPWSLVPELMGYEPIYKWEYPVQCELTMGSQQLMIPRSKYCWHSHLETGRMRQLQTIYSKLAKRLIVRTEKTPYHWDADKTKWPNGQTKWPNGWWFESTSIYKNHPLESSWWYQLGTISHV